EHIFYGYEDAEEPLLIDLELVIEREERVALLGANGAGKSTIIRLAAGELAPSRGIIRLGHNVTPAYQDQQLARLQGDKTVLEDALLKYRGTLLFVSHDRYFLRKLATRVVELEKGKLRNYLGGYDYYRSSRRLNAREGGSRNRTRRRVRSDLDKHQNVVAAR